MAIKGLLAVAALAGVVEFTAVENIAVDDTVLTETTIVLWPERSNDRPLSEQDIRDVAQELGVEPAVIHAVIDIEAGKAHKGFWSAGKPVINFDLSVYRRNIAKRKVKVDQKRHPVVMAPLNIRKYGSQQAAVQARLDDAMSIDAATAIESTFWGMFQIGGFNWKLCGYSSPQEFVEHMSMSEREQLEIFARFIKAYPKMWDALRRKDWAAFSRIYNGPSYAKRGYHTRLAASYNTWKNKSH